MGFIIGKNHPQMTMNILEAVMSESALRPYLVNWEPVARTSAAPVTQASFGLWQSAHQELFDKLFGMSPPAAWQHPDESKLEGPMLTVVFKVLDFIKRRFSTLSQFGTALDTGMEELVIESYCPADNASREFFEQSEC